MKKKLIITAMVLGLAFTGMQQASARGYGGGYGGDCPQGCRSVFSQQVVDDEMKSKIDAFKQDTVELRKQMAMKRAEKRALMQAENPDAKAVAAVEGELFDLRLTMQEKAKEAGVPYFDGRGMKKGMGGDRGYQRGFSPCGKQARWN